MLDCSYIHTYIHTYYGLEQTSTYIHTYIHPYIHIHGAVHVRQTTAAHRRRCAVHETLVLCRVLHVTALPHIGIVRGMAHDCTREAGQQIGG